MTMKFAAKLNLKLNQMVNEKYIAYFFYSQWCNHRGIKNGKGDGGVFSPVALASAITWIIFMLSLSLQTNIKINCVVC